MYLTILDFQQNSTYIYKIPSTKVTEEDIFIFMEDRNHSINNCHYMITNHKTIFDNSDTDNINIKKGWLEGLLEYADDAEKELKETKNTFNLYALLGYISSAKTILKLK